MIELLLRLIILNCITFYVIFNILVAPLLSWHDTLSNNYNIPWLLVNSIMELLGSNHSDFTLIAVRLKYRIFTASTGRTRSARRERAATPKINIAGLWFTGPVR
jgi:hypothetical protein